jgi:hypothetical protein
MCACGWLPPASRSIRQKAGDPWRRPAGAHRPSTGALPRQAASYTVYNRQALIPGDSFSGPAIITEYSSATILPPGDRLHVDALDNLIIEVH